ncbi:MAG: FISUMP domain-containing protein [Bacteroidales bacterium]
MAYPNMDEWSNLHILVSENFYQTEGKALKSLNGWAEDANGTDNFGFNAIPAGVRTIEGSVIKLETKASWWTGTEASALTANTKYIGQGVLFYWDSSYKFEGNSVRCIKD